MPSHLQLSGSPIVQIVLSSSEKFAVMNLWWPEKNVHYTGGDFTDIYLVVIRLKKHRKSIMIAVR